MATETAQQQSVPPDVSEHLTIDDRVGLLRAMLMMRGIEERAMTLYRQGKVPGSFYDGFGQEAVSAGATWAMGARDRLCVLHRDLAAHIIRGVEPARIFAQYMGRADGPTKGRDERHALCLYVSTDQTPPGIPRDTSQDPNSIFPRPPG